MKKETTNTFNEGMIKDLHPLTTPNNVLTDALNATLVTYNGNENILQNDMGNVKVSHALLKSGYVPVGMKEHGGIIYVAAYNPKTKKGQVGSFPSPQQLWESENWTVNAPKTIIPTVTIPSIFYDGVFIINEVVKQELFKSADGEPRIFHPGDKYVIRFPAKGSIAPYVSLGYLDIQLGVIKSDGGIEIMKTWSKDTSGDFLYGGSASPSTLLSDPNVVQVFNSSSSGELIIIFNLNTLDSFNLLREYSLVRNGDTESIKVTFRGEAQKDNKTLTSSNAGNLSLSTATEYEKETIERQRQVPENENQSMGSETLTIYPTVPFGIIKRMGRKVKVDFDKIRKSQDDFGEWRFFVTDSYMKIGWSYDFYNLDGSKEIEYIRMYFHPLENGYKSTDKEELAHIDFQRESYNGNFEDYVDYKQIGLLYKHIYITEIVKKFKDENEEKIIAFKMLYLSKLYNDQYNGFYENKAIGLSGENGKTQEKIPEFKALPTQAALISFKDESEIRLEDSITEVKQPGEDDFLHSQDTLTIDGSMYVKEIDSADLGNIQASKRYFVSKINNTYDINVKFKGEISNYNEDIIGAPRTDLISKLATSYIGRTPSIVTSQNKKFEPSSPSFSFPTITSLAPSVISKDLTVKYTDDMLCLDNLKVSDIRHIQGRASGLLSSPYTAKGLMPLYSSKYSEDRQSRVAVYKNSREMLCLGSNGHDTIYYNCTVGGKNVTIVGIDAGGGCDDGGLKSAGYNMNSMTNMLTGVNGEESELTFEDLHGQDGHFEGDDRNFISHKTTNDGNIIKWQSEDYLVACWKFTDGTLKFVNQLSKRSDPVDATRKWPRLDVIMKCILSQLFVVNSITKSVSYITTDERFYSYETGTSTLKIKFVQGDATEFNKIKEDIMVNPEVNPNKPLTEYLTEKWGYSNGQITVGGNSYPFVNLIPKVEVSAENISTDGVELELPQEDNVDLVLTNYYGVEYTQPKNDDGENLNVQSIYGIDTNQTSYNTQACKGHQLKPNPDGTYIWDTTPKCVEITSSNSTFKMYRWNDQTTVTFPQFYQNFKTTAKLEGWTDISEGEENEILADSDTFARGWWSNAKEEDAPDMYYKVLYSPQISPLKNHL